MNQHEGCLDKESVEIYVDKIVEATREKFEMIRVWAKIAGEGRLYDMLSGNTTVIEYLKRMIEIDNEYIDKSEKTIRDLEYQRDHVNKSNDPKIIEIWNNAIERIRDKVKKGKTRIAFAEGYLKEHPEKWVVNDQISNVAVKGRTMSEEAYSIKEQENGKEEKKE
jgi:hypothetical protein